MGTTPGVVIAGRSVPLSIAIIGGLRILGAFYILLSLFLHMPTLLFGFLITGLGAIVSTLLIGLAQGYVGIDNAWLGLSKWGSGQCSCFVK